MDVEVKQLMELDINVLNVLPLISVKNVKWISIMDIIWLKWNILIKKKKKRKELLIIAIFGWKDMGIDMDMDMVMDMVKNMGFGIQDYGQQINVIGCVNVLVGNQKIMSYLLKLIFI